MRIIFLDFDGVLNSQAARAAAEPGKLIATTLLPVFESKRIDRVLRLTKEAGAFIVVSSTWGGMLPLDTLIGCATSAGLVRIVDVLHSARFQPNEPKQNLILDWVRKNSPESWVVLDDLALPGLPSLVRCEDGIEEEHVAQALKILRRTPVAQEEQSRWLVCIMRETEPPKVTFFDNEEKAQHFYEAGATQWSMAFLTRVLKGPRLT